MKNTFELNGKTYTAKAFSYNMICDLDDMGIGITDASTRPNSFIRGYIAVCGDMTKEQGTENYNAQDSGETVNYENSRERFRNESLPFALLIGMTEQQFWESNPRTMRPYIKAYKLRLKHEDELAWLNGTYICEALMSTVCGMFRSKGSEPYNYPEKPRMAEAEERKQLDNHELTQEEIMAQTNMLFASLAVMQGNFEIERGRG